MYKELKKYLLLGGFLLIAAFSVFFGGVSQVEAVVGTGCGDATGSGATIADKTLTDLPRSWNLKRWEGGTLTITGSVDASGTAVPADIGKKGTVAVDGSKANTITINSWSVTPTGTKFSYSVTAKPNACRVGIGDAAKDYSCLQIGDAGYCKGPCESNVACNVFTTSGDKSVGWEGTKCTGTATVPGVCLEGPRSSSTLSETASASTGAGLLILIDTITNWFFAIFTVLALIFVLLAAFQFVTGGGDEAKMSEARQKLIWAAVGIIIALLAKGLVPVIKAIVGG